MFSEVLSIFAACVLLSLIAYGLQRSRFGSPRSSMQTEPENLSAATTHVTFRNLVIESDHGHGTPYTEIDELIVSPYGIFCVEVKARVGYIFGSYDAEKWTQCKFAERDRFQNPLHQNYKHIKALERLLGDRLKMRIHNLVLFTNARLVEVSDRRVLMSREELERSLERHTTPIYTSEEYREICELLAYESTLSDVRMPVHIASLQQQFVQA